MKAVKVSFGFKSANKKLLKFVPVNQKKSNPGKEFIKSIDEGKVEWATVKTEAPEAQVIPLPTSSKSYRERLLARNSNVNKESGPIKTDTVTDLSKLSLNQRAELEILQDLQKKSDDAEATKNYLIPASTSDESEKIKESTLDDYEDVPITGFGLAMLRGMGLKDENLTKSAVTEDFNFRPKGLGLGADNAVKPRELKVPLKAGEVLTTKKGANIVVLAGNYKDFYGTVSDNFFIKIIEIDL